jgi:hypothetical protein
MQFSKPTPPIGFSTGALALSDWRLGLERSRALGVQAVELSALRLVEFAPLVATARTLELSDFSYVSVHLPSSYKPADEIGVLRAAGDIAFRGWPLILHPDTVSDWTGWRSFGSLICLENMDKRKPVGRTVEELSEAFEQLPEAGFCFDYGHARQVDPTMSQAARLLAEFGERLRQIHFSDVDASNHHRTLNYSALAAFARVRHIITSAAPVILETLVDQGGAEIQLKLARAFFSNVPEAAVA